MTATARCAWPSPWWQWTVPALCLLTAALIWTLDANQSLFIWLNHFGLTDAPNGNAAHDRFWASATLLGDTLVAFSLLALLLRKRPDIVWTLLLTALFTTLWVHGLKNAVDALRPLAVLGTEQVHVIGKGLNRNSFPSGHTATAFTLAAVICLRGVHPALAVGALLLATLGGISRIMVGAHWPLDVLAGALGGWLCALIGIRLYACWPAPSRPVARLIIGLILLGCALSLLLIHESGYPLARPLEQALASISLAYLLWAGWQDYHRSRLHRQSAD